MSTRRGACPSLREPMATGDGLLVRLSPAGTGWTPQELSTLAAAAERFGNGILEVTSRGNLQIRGLTAESVEGLASEIEVAAIPLRTGLAIDTGPLAGIDADENADPLPLARALHDAVEAAGLTARLAPKCAVVIDGGGRLPLDDLIADVRVAADPTGGSQWLISVGGTARVARPVGYVVETDVFSMVIGILEAIAAKGQMARGRDLTDGEITKLRDSPPLRRRFAAPPLSPSRGERIVGTTSPHPVLLQTGEVSCETRRKGGPPVGRFPLRDAMFATAFVLPFGQVESHTLAAFCVAASQVGAREIRLAPGRGLIVPGLLAESCATLEAKALALGFITDAQDSRLCIAACAGAPFCASAHFATRDLGMEIAARAPDLLVGRMLHISGCAKRCAEPPAPDFTLLGAEGGCLVLPGDGRNAPAVPAVAPEEALAALRRLADTELTHDKPLARETQPADS